MKRFKMTTRAVFFVAVAASTGCFRSLPPPKLREANLSPTESYEKVCASGLKRADVSLHGEHPLSGVLECDSEKATIAIFNSLKLRVRTISVSKDGGLRDEISYLAPAHESAELLLEEISSALLAPPDKTDTPRLTIQIRERQKRR